MRRRNGLRSQPSILERRIRLIAGLLRAVRGLGTRLGLGRGHGIGIMGITGFTSVVYANPVMARFWRDPAHNGCFLSQFSNREPRLRSVKERDGQSLK